MKKILFLACMIFSLSVVFAQKGHSRSAKSGKYVTKSYADNHKATTITYRKKSK